MTKILVIEDEPNLRKVIRANLIASGYEVSTASNGEDGLKLAQNDTPDLILLDIKMPGMSGWNVLTALRNSPRCQRVPLIIVTAFLGQNEAVRAHEMGAGYITKPFAVGELLSEIKQAIGE